MDHTLQSTGGLPVKASDFSIRPSCGGLSPNRPKSFVLSANANILYIHTVFARAIMPRKQLPDFPSPTTRQLRELWRKYPDDTAVQRACLEIERMRGVFLEIEAYRVVVERCWREETRSTLVGLEKMRMLIEGERSRLGISRDEIPTASNEAGKRYP
jgi:hypothetical protein